MAENQNTSETALEKLSRSFAADREHYDDQLKVRKNHGYAPDEALDYRRVRCYVTEVDKNQRYVGIGAKCDIDKEYGIEVPTFDETINEQNNICSEILYDDVLS